MREETKTAAATWLSPQHWQRNGDQPCIALGEEGAFDDTHIFAPCVVLEDGCYSLWYCGSQGSVSGRVFALGLATSSDGVRFARHPASPVFTFGDGTRSILTPALLRNPDGSVRRKNGRLRLWFSSCDFPSGNKLHTLHETTSGDGLSWEPPSEAQLEDVYAPTLIEEADTYRMWYTDVRSEPWCFRYAESRDGRRWDVESKPVLQLDQAWEHQRLFYPTVLKADDVYLMWYGSYSHRKGEEMKTSLGLAVSIDGMRWQKNPDNPIFGPDGSHPWESHYTTSQSLLRLPDGSWRIWYASRPKPPFEHKYFAIGTAQWSGFVAERTER